MSDIIKSNTASRSASSVNPPPPNNMGVEFCLHWLAVTFWAAPNVVAEFALHLIGLDVGRYDGLTLFELKPHGAQGYKRLYVGPLGLRLMAEPSSGGEHCHLVIPGEVCKTIPPARLTDFQKFAGRWNITRLDTAFDSTLFAPADIWQAVEAGDVRTLAKRKTLKEWRDLAGGHTVYLGSRTSGRMLRCYKKAENGRDFTRLEIEYKGERARAVFADLLDTTEAWAKKAFAHLRDFVDFKRDWWAAFTSGIERAKLVLTRITSSIEKKMEWARRQVAPTLALIEQIAGFSEIVKLLDDGRRRWGPSHHSVLLLQNVVST